MEKFYERGNIIQHRDNFTVNMLMYFLFLCIVV